MPAIHVYDGEAADRLAPAVWPVYDEVFADHATEATWRAGMFDRHREREGFRLALARDGDEVVGFGWSYVGRRGQLWTDWVALLGTETSPTSRAVRLYASRGWRPLGLLTPEVQVMGWRAD